MTRWHRAVVVVALLLACGGVAVAQTGGEEGYYLDEETDDAPGRFSLGIGFGLVELGDNVIQGQTLLIDDDVEPYYVVNLRIAFGDRHAYGHAVRGGFRGYLEPELGYWSSSSPGASQSDTLVGLNIVGGVPMSAVEFFVGAGVAIHFLDSTAVNIAGIADTEDETIGVNAHFGLDIAVSRRVSVFGVGRFDLVDDDRDELEGKAYLGLRFRI